jgi:glycosyltransferase involved in cell wall biosynthesis
MRILMIVENCAFLKDPRVRKEAETLNSVGHRVSVVCPRENRRPWYERIDGISIYRFRPIEGGTNPWGFLFEYTYATLAVALFSLIVLLREGFDVIHVANPPDTLVLTVLLYKFIGKRIIYDQHDLCPELYKAKFPRFSKVLFYLLQWLERQSYALADHVITTNESYKQIAIARGQIAESKVTVVRNGPDMETLSVREVEVELRRKSSNIIAYSGIIGCQDGVECLCHILHHLRYDLCREDFCCLVLGDGGALPRVRDLARELCLEKNIWFAGWIDDPKTYLRYLNTADICVSPEPSNDYNKRSTFVKVMEYMALGKPIVAFDLSETRFSAQNSALYVAANDTREFAVQLARLMDDPILRLELGHSGQNRIRQQLAWQYSVPNLLDAYKQCASKSFWFSARHKGSAEAQVTESTILEPESVRQTTEGNCKGRMQRLKSNRRRAATLTTATVFLLYCGLSFGSGVAQITGKNIAQISAHEINPANANEGGAGGASSSSVGQSKLHSVKLSWNPSAPATKLPRDAVIGYIVYRSNKPKDANALPINSSRLVDTTFVDASVKPGTYYYVTRAVSATGRVSGPSNEVRVDISAK